jgi:hypothetical protein
MARGKWTHHSNILQIQTSTGVERTHPALRTGGLINWPPRHTVMQTQTK